MSDAEIAYLPARRLSERIRTKQLGSLEATDLFIRRIEARDEGVNAVVVRDFDRARDDARERDRRLARGDRVGPLHGVPMTIKEQYHRAGLPTTFGYAELAVWASDDVAPVDDEIADRARLVARALRDAGATVSEVARPDIDPQHSHETYQNLSYSVVFASVPPEEYERNRRDAERYAPTDRSGPAVISRSMVLSHADWLREDARRGRLRLRWAEFFRDSDILICPQMAVPAFEHDHSTPIEERTVPVNGAPQEYWKQAFWSGLVTAPCLPSTVFPTGLSRQGLPIGLQAVGDAYRDYQTIDFTRLLAREVGGFRRPPID